MLQHSAIHKPLEKDSERRHEESPYRIAIAKETENGCRAACQDEFGEQKHAHGEELNRDHA